MLITCPSCASAFRIDIDRLGPEGRSVRCGACREPWFVSPAEVVAAQAEEIGAGAASMPDPAAEMAAIDPELAAWLAADPEPMRPEGDVVENIPPAPGRPAKALGKARAGTAMPSARRGLAGLSPATAAGLAILAALPLACLARVPVVRALPQTAGLYARIGLPVNLRGLELRDVVAYRNPADPSRPAELIIEGDLVGIARGGSPVPALEVALRDTAGHTLRAYPVPAPRPVLGEGESARFRARFPDPPDLGRSVELRFAEAVKADSSGADSSRAEPVKADPAHAAAQGHEAAAHPAPASASPTLEKAAADHAPAHAH